MCVCVNYIYIYVVLGVTVSSVEIKRTFKTHQVKWSRIYNDLLIWHRLWCDRWSVVEFRLCILVLWWRSRYALLMRPNKVGIAVQGSVCRKETLPNFLVMVIKFIYVVPSICFQTFLYKPLKLASTFKNSVCYCYTSCEMTDQFQIQNEQLQVQLDTPY